MIIVLRTRYMLAYSAGRLGQLGGILSGSEGVCSSPVGILDVQSPVRGKDIGNESKGDGSRR